MKFTRLIKKCCFYRKIAVDRSVPGGEVAVVVDGDFGGGGADGQSDGAGEGC